MIDKQDFYHGAALAGLISHSEFESIKKNDDGFVVGNCFIMFKYRTKTASPWQFSLQPQEIEHLNKHSKSYEQIVIGFICGADGICSLFWHELLTVIEESNAWVTVRCGFKGRYGVSGSKGTLPFKVPRKRWPELLFKENAGAL